MTHVLLTDRNPADGRPSMLVDATPGAPGTPRLAPLRLAPEPTFVVAPDGDGRPVDEARLPTELDFPLTSLWQVRRPGPLLELFALAP